MKKLLNYLKIFFSQDRYFYGIFIIFIILLGQLPIILHIFRTPAGFYYPLLDRTSFSDYYYLGLIRYGMGPEWMLSIPYIIYEHQASLIQIFFVLLGKLSAFTGIGPAEIFALFRILGGVIYSISAAILLKTIFPKNLARMAFVIFLLIQPIPALDIFSRTSNDFDNWVWHFGEAARKISAVPPHYSFGKGLMVLSLANLFSFLKNRRMKYIVVAGLTIFIAGIIYPPPVFIVLFSLTIAVAFYCFVRGPLAVLQGVPFKKLNFSLIFYLLMTFLPLIILKMELARGYPWDMWNKVELGWNTRAMQFEWGYIRSLGIIVYLVPFAFFYFRNRKISFENIFVFAWFFSSFLLFPFANFLKLGKFRLIEGSQVVAMSILAVWGIEYLREIKVAAKLKKVFACFFLANFLVFTILQIRWATVRLWPLWTNVYFRPQEREVFNFLSSNARRDAIVAADAFASNYLPAMVRVRTILGFPDFYPKVRDFMSEETDILNILNGRMKEGEAEKYLEKKNIDYVYADISKYPKKELYPKTLTVVYQNELFILYEVKR